MPTYTTSVGLPKICLAFDGRTQMKISRTVPDVASPGHVISSSDFNNSWCHRDFVQFIVLRIFVWHVWFWVIELPLFVYCHHSLLFIVSEYVRLSLFQINTTGPNWSLLKTRLGLLCVNFWLADKPRLLLICFSVLFHTYEALKRNRNVKSQFYFTCKRRLSLYRRKFMNASRRENLSIPTVCYIIKRIWRKMQLQGVWKTRSRPI